MITLKQMLVRGTCTIFVLSLMGFLPGSGLITAGRAVAQDAVDIDEMLKQSPEKMPQNYSDEEIDQMLQDVQQIDDSSDTQGSEDSLQPDISDEDRALVEDIRNNPEKYAEQIKTKVWLNAHPWVIWSLCSDFVWIDANPNFAARIYLNYDFWCRYPKIAFIIVSNRPFLVRYPRITARIYLYDDWFLGHPFCAREIYRNHLFFVRYPGYADRYYRHHQWMRGHPGVVRIAYGDPEIFRAHPQYLGHVYEYRRLAVRNHLIRQAHLPQMRDRWKHEFSRDRSHDNKPRIKYGRPDKGSERNKGRTIDNRRQPDKGRTIDNRRQPDKGRTIDNRRQPDSGRTIDNRRQPDGGREGDQGRTIDNRRQPDRGRTIDNSRQPGNGRNRDNGMKIGQGQRGGGDGGKNK
jgi:hypothetical protein